MMNVGQCIREWRSRRGLSQTALAASAGVGSSMVGKYERGEASPTVQQLESIASAMKLTLVELLTDPDAPDHGTCSESSEPIAGYDSVSILMIPFVEDWRGDPVPESISTFWPVKRRILPHRSCLATRVKGDAMYPFLLDRDIVIVDAQVQSFGNGNLVLVRSRGEILVRRLLRSRRRRTLEAYNHSFMPIMMTDEHELIGRIIALVERTLRSGTGLRSTLPPPAQ